MFLISQAEAANFSAALEHIDQILEKGGAEVLAMRKWDERRLAFEIDKQKRGVFILSYFKAAGDAVTRIERECTLSEHVMRVLVVRADHMSEDQARAANDREGLITEAKLRAERAAAGEAEQRRMGARLGAPEPEAAEAEDSEPEAADDED
jgi:small subunit ribosomal protein S6